MNDKLAQSVFRLILIGMLCFAILLLNARVAGLEGRMAKQAERIENLEAYRGAGG